MPSAAILAGGRASRFGGRDKSALVVEGQPILDRPLAALVHINTPAEYEGLDRTIGHEL
jgi:molybdopterin-guanine dinucleotide biosynthesis protein A